MNRMKELLPLVATALLASAANPNVATGQEVRVKGVDSLDVRANIQAQFNTTSVDDEPSSEWLMRRARIGLGAHAAGWIYAFVEGDFARGRPRLTDGYVRLDFAPSFRLRAGQYKMPFDVLELVSSRELLVVERDGTPRGAGGVTPNGLLNDLGYSNRDIGAEWSGGFAPLTLTAGIFNGAGDNEAEDDDGKQLAARAEVELGGTWGASGAWSGQRVSEPPDAENASWYNAFELAVTGGEYAEPGLKALGQIFFGDNFDPDLGGGDDASLVAAQGILAYHFPIYRTPYLIGWEPVARLGWTDPDTDLDDDEAALWTGGVNVYHHRRVKTQAQVDVLDPAEGDAETAFRLMVVLGF